MHTIIANHWKDLGTELLEKEHVHELTTIETNHHHDVKVCCREMFNYWLRVDCNANWNQLITALYMINLTALAQQIHDDVFIGNVMSIATELVANKCSLLAITTCCIFTYVCYIVS